MIAKAAGVDYVAFNLVIDDIVCPDGTTIMARLGGGGPQAACGMRLWCSNVGLSGSVGQDFPQILWDELSAAGIDLGGIRRASTPTPRAWQILEQDGRRTQLWRVDQASLSQHLRRRIAHLPQAYRKARAYHLGVHPLDADLDFLQELHALGGLVSVETYKPAERPLSPQELEALLKSADIFSMNALEAESLLGKSKWEEQLDALFAAGARRVALRWDKNGCLAADGRLAVHVPAVAAEGRSPVGAGNAFCGAFLTGWIETQDITIAACRAITAAALFISNGYRMAGQTTLADDYLRSLSGRVERWS